MCLVNKIITSRGDLLELLSDIENRTVFQQHIIDQLTYHLDELIRSEQKKLVENRLVNQGEGA